MKTNTYQHKIKTLTQMVKNLHPLVAKIPAPLPALDSKANKFAQKLSIKEVTARKEVFGKINGKRLDKAAVKYWLVSTES